MNKFDQGLRFVHNPTKSTKRRPLQRLACTNRAGKYLIGQFSLVNNKDGGYLCGKIFCCLLNQFLSCSRLENLRNTSKSTRQLV